MVTRLAALQLLGLGADPATVVGSQAITGAQLYSATEVQLIQRKEYLYGSLKTKCPTSEPVLAEVGTLEREQRRRIIEAMQQSSNRTLMVYGGFALLGGIAVGWFVKGRK